MHNITSPRVDDACIESEIVAKGKVAPRVTPADVEANIADERFFTAAEGVTGADRLAGVTASCFPRSLELLTFCVLTLQNGFTVVGQSACASPENFDAEIGQRIARQDAVNKIWPLMRYQLRERLADEEYARFAATQPELPIG